MDAHEEELLKELANTILEQFNEEMSQESDPVDVYFKKLISHFHLDNPKLFRSRFTRGYMVLADEMQNK